MQKYAERVDVFERYSYPLIHGPLAALIVKYDFLCDDEEIFDAIWYHTTGKENMPLLTKIIYLADFIEPNRDFEGVDALRSLAKTDLDAAMCMGLEMTVRLLEKQGSAVCPDSLAALMEMKKESQLC